MTNKELIEALADVAADMAASDRPSREIVIAIIRRWRDLGPSEESVRAGAVAIELAYPSPELDPSDADYWWGSCWRNEASACLPAMLTSLLGDPK